MSFFQNVFPTEFRGNLVLGDRAQVLTFICPSNKGRGDEIVRPWVDGPYNLSGDDSDGNPANILNIWYAYDALNFTNWGLLSINIASTAADPSAVTPTEIASALNANSVFSGLFSINVNYATPNTFTISQTLPYIKMHFYIANGRAEEILKFNLRSGVAELPTYFSRHQISSYLSAAQRTSYTDSLNALILLNPGSSDVDSGVITNAEDGKGVDLNLDPSTVRADYQLFRGRSEIFLFQKLTVDSSSRITQIIEYPAGAVIGDFAKLTKYTYTGAKTEPDQMTQEPYTLASGDLITP